MQHAKERVALHGSLLGAHLTTQALATMRTTHPAATHPAATMRTTHPATLMCSTHLHLPRVDQVVGPGQRTPREPMRSRLRPA